MARGDILSGVSLLLIGCCCVLAIIAAVEPKFIYDNSLSDWGIDNMEFKGGAFKLCLGDECKSIDKDCKITFEILKQPISKNYPANCDKFNAFRGSLLAGIFLLGLSVLVGILQLVISKEPTTGIATFVLSLFGSICLMISMAIFTDQFDSRTARDHYGASYIMLCISWSVAFLSSFIWLTSRSAHHRASSSTDYSAMNY